MLAALLVNEPLAGHPGKGFRRHYIPIETVEEHKEHTEEPKKVLAPVEIEIEAVVDDFLDAQEIKDKKRRANNRKALMLWFTRD